LVELENLDGAADCASTGVCETHAGAAVIRLTTSTRLHKLYCMFNGFVPLGRGDSLSLIACGFAIFLTVENHAANAQEKKSKVTGRSSQSSTTDSELGRLRADVIEKMKETRASTKKLLALHEAEVKKGAAEFQQRREFHNQGLISRAEFDQSEQALAAAIARVEADKRWITETDIALTEYSMRDLLLGLPIMPPGGYAESGALIRFNGAASWSLSNVGMIEKFFLQTFGHGLPISAFGQTLTHDRLKFDHRGALDVALHPDSSEGRALLSYLRQAGIPFLAFRGAVTGAATGAHIHIGKPSLRSASNAESGSECCQR
jgi:hypothetical protein